MSNLLPALDRFLEVAAVVRKDQLVRPLESTFAPRIRAAFKLQEDTFMAGFETLQDQFPVAESVRLHEALRDDWVPIWEAAMIASLDAFEIPFGEFIQLALELGIQEAVATLKVDIDFDLEHPRAVSYMQGRAGDRVSLVNATTKEDIRRIVTRGVDEGKSYQQVAKELRDEYASFRVPKPQQHIRDRAELIAITEIGEGYEAGNLAVAEELQASGLQMVKSWLTVGDSRVSEGCKENQGAGWIALGDAFPSGHQRPLRFPGCRCTLLSQRKGSEGTE